MVSKSLWAYYFGLLDTVLNRVLEGLSWRTGNAEMRGQEARRRQERASLFREFLEELVGFGGA